MQDGFMGGDRSHQPYFLFAVSICTTQRVKSYTSQRYHRRSYRYRFRPQCGRPVNEPCPNHPLLEIKYSWVFNGQRGFLQQDARRFISQKTGNLYIAKVEASDAGNYTCAVRNMMTNATVLSSPTPVVVRRDGKRPPLASAAPVYPAHWADAHGRGRGGTPRR